MRAQHLFLSQEVELSIESLFITPINYTFLVSHPVSGVSSRLIQTQLVLHLTNDRRVSQ